MVKLLVQDEDRVGGRKIATDFLRDPAAYAMRKTAANECSDLEPCPAGFPDCVIAANAMKGYCPDPLNPGENSGGAVGPPFRLGGNAIRFVFNKLLDAKIDLTLMDAMATSPVTLKAPDGSEVPTRKYFDPTGDPFLTSDVFAAPYGPAIVLKPLSQLNACTKYTAHLDTASIKDRSGNAVDKAGTGADVFQDKSSKINATTAIKSDYEIQMEPLYASDGVTPDFVADTAVMIAPNDFFQVLTNAGISDATATSTVVEVKNEAGDTIHTIAFADCDGGPQVLDIVRTSSITGEALAWDPGTYTITTHVRNGGDECDLQYDIGGTKLEGGFVVSADASATNPIENVTLPKDCGGSM